VLDRRLPGDEGRRARPRGQRVSQRLRVALRVLEVERRVDLAEDDAASGSEDVEVPGRDDVRRALEPCPETGAQRGVGRVRDAEDDGEGAVGPVAEMPREDRPRAVGVGAGNLERVREQPGKPRRRPHAHDEDDEPDGEDGDSKAKDAAGPALEHVTDTNGGVRERRSVSPACPDRERAACRDRRYDRATCGANRSFKS
jgi:hypothetical protein